MKTKAKPPKFNMECHFNNPTTHDQRINLLMAIYGIYDRKELILHIVNKAQCGDPGFPYGQLQKPKVRVVKVNIEDFL